MAVDGLRLLLSFAYNLFEAHKTHDVFDAMNDIADRAKRA
jgi:hypothetical protein